jgi:hypothetical protein
MHIRQKVKYKFVCTIYQFTNSWIFEKSCDSLGIMMWSWRPALQMRHKLNELDVFLSGAFPTTYIIIQNSFFMPHHVGLSFINVIPVYFYIYFFAVRFIFVLKLYKAIVASLTIHALVWAIIIVARGSSRNDFGSILLVCDPRYHCCTTIGFNNGMCFIQFYPPWKSLRTYSCITFCVLGPTASQRWIPAMDFNLENRQMWNDTARYTWPAHTVSFTHVRAWKTPTKPERSIKRNLNS